MKNRKITILLMAVALLFGATSCTDWLTVKPESKIILEEYWQSESDVESVLFACYRKLISDDCMYRMIVWGELRSDNFIASPLGFDKTREDISKILKGELTANNGYASWGAFYSVINYCNTVLKYAPEVVNRDKNFSSADLKKIEAETRAIRALCYFYLVRTFNEVPWVDVASVDDTQDYLPAKSTYREIMDHILDDLTFAQQNIRSDFGRKDFNKGRFILSSVNALLTDVYLWDEQYDKCVQTADLVLADKNLELIETKFNNFYQVFYLGQSSETILELQFDPAVQKNNPVIVLYGSQTTDNPELRFPANIAFNPYSTTPSSLYSPFYYKLSSTVLESEKDIRAKDSYISSGENFKIFKYAGRYRSDVVVNGVTIGGYSYRSETSNWILYRLADVMLMKAEALAQLGGEENNKKVMELVNNTYLRSNTSQDGKTIADSLKLANYTTPAAISGLVLRERHRELLFEGKRWFDLVRMARREKSTNNLNTLVNYKLSGSTVTLGASVLDAMYMPIAQSELNANKNLVQNSYYQTAASSSTR